MRTARLKFSQSMTKDPKAHQLFWSCVLGKYEFAQHPQTNAWAEQYCNDISELGHVDGVQHIVQCVDESRKKNPRPSPKTSAC